MSTVGFKVLTTAVMNVAIFRDIAPYRILPSHLLHAGFLLG
jgi:hypothetical protein